MGGICGWINGPLETDLAITVLNDMARPIGGIDTNCPAPIIANASALAACKGIVSADIHRAGSLLAAVEGHIHWRTAESITLAHEQGPAAALAEVYRIHGDDCLREIHGPFAIAVIDAHKGGGLLAIDRMGIRTMCYANPAGQLVFGSTADSLVAHPKLGPRPSDQAIFNYLFCHVVPSPGTIYQGVQKLLPGECVSFRNGSVEKRFYWRLHYHDQSDESFTALESRFHQLLREAVRRAIDGDTAIGAFLSGGTDSSTITGLLAELTGKPVKTFSIGFAADGFDEMAYARITARHFKTTAHEYYLKPQDVIEAIPIIAQAYDEPFGNDSAVPTYFCARMARTHGTQVMLAGDGGDEIFGGNARYAKQKIFESYALIPTALRRRLIEPLAKIPGGDRLAPLRKLKSYLRQASVPLPERLESYNFLHQLPVAEIFDPAFLAKVDLEEPLALLRAAYQGTHSSSPINRMMHLDLKQTLADNDLRKVSRMCDVAGLEVRYPLLDEALVEFSGEIPASLKVRGLQLRYFFKHALKEFLPPQTIVKPKHGFGLPFGLWLRDHKPLAELVHSSLDAFTCRSIVRPDYIKGLVRQHTTSHATYFGSMIWVIMMLERWLEARKL